MGNVGAINNFFTRPSISVLMESLQATF